MTETVPNRHPLEGGCACRQVRYRVKAAPLFVHCCHCSWCQRETGSAFAVNALIEATQVTLLAGEVANASIPSASGRGQHVSRCANCLVALWSTYPDAGPAILFLRAGTLDRPDCVPPDIHIYTSTRLSWLNPAFGGRSVPGFYDLKETWPAASLARYRTARASAALDASSGN